MVETGEGFRAQAFLRVDEGHDAAYFESCDKNFSMDEGGRRAVAALYGSILAPDAEILDLMAGPQSALPDDIAYPSVTGLDISDHLMQKNTRLSSRVVVDLNEESATLPFEDGQFDAVLLNDGIAYLKNPQGVFMEVERILRSGGALVVTFSDRFYPRKAFALWQALDAPDRVRLVTLLMERASLSQIDTGDVVPPEDLPAWQDSVHAIIGRKPLGF